LEFKQKILTKCPAERFCSLPTGEICVYGIGEISKMTQISWQDIIRFIFKDSSPDVKIKYIRQIPSIGITKGALFLDWFSVVFAFFIGIVFGIIITKKPLSKNKS